MKIIQFNIENWKKIKLYFSTIKIVLLKLLAMDIVMMKSIMLTATMMVVTVVEFVLSTQKTVQNVYVMKEASH